MCMGDLTIIKNPHIITLLLDAIDHDEKHIHIIIKNFKSFSWNTIYNIC